MDATAELTGTPTREDYTSRPGALIWFFRKSRDRLEEEVPGPQGHRQGVQESDRRRDQEPRAVATEGRASQRASSRPWKLRSRNCGPRQQRRRIKKNGRGRAAC